MKFHNSPLFGLSLNVIQKQWSDTTTHFYFSDNATIPGNG